VGGRGRFQFFFSLSTDPDGLEDRDGWSGFLFETRRRTPWWSCIDRESPRIQAVGPGPSRRSPIHPADSRPPGLRRKPTHPRPYCPPTAQPPLLAALEGVATGRVEHCVNPRPTSAIHLHPSSDSFLSVFPLKSGRPKAYPGPSRHVVWRTKLRPTQKQIPVVKAVALGP